MLLTSVISVTTWLLVLPSRALSIQRSEALDEPSLANFTQEVTHELHRRVRIGGTSGPGGVGGIKDLFLIDSDSHCDNHISTLDAWVQEAAALHTGVEHAYHHAEGKWPPYVIHWLVYFGVQWDFRTMTRQDDLLNDQVWGDIGDHIGRVTQFLGGGGLKNPQNPGQKPRLFCSGDAFELQDGSRAVRDSDGEDIVTDRDDTTQLPTEYLTVDRAFASQRAQGGNVFWVPGFKGYDISSKPDMCPALTNGEGRLARCARPTSSGIYNYVNQHGRQVEYNLGKANRHMILCPGAFTTTTGHSVPSLSDTVGSMYPSSTGDGDKGKALDRMLTRGSTFYHELYHLTDNDHTLGGRDELYSLPQIVNSAKNPNPRLRNVHNPESYAYLAQALHMYRNRPSGKNRILYAGTFPDDPAKYGHNEDHWAQVSRLP